MCGGVLWFQSVWSGVGPNTLLCYFWFAGPSPSMNPVFALSLLKEQLPLCGLINLSDLLCFLVFACEVDVDPQAEDTHTVR